MGPAQEWAGGGGGLATIAGTLDATVTKETTFGAGLTRAVFGLENTGKLYVFEDGGDDVYETDPVTGDMTLVGSGDDVSLGWAPIPETETIVAHAYSSGTIRVRSTVDFVTISSEALPGDRSTRGMVIADGFLWHRTASSSGGTLIKRSLADYSVLETWSLCWPAQDLNMATSGLIHMGGKFWALNRDNDTLEGFNPASPDDPLEVVSLGGSPTLSFWSGFTTLGGKVWINTDTQLLAYI